VNEKLPAIYLARHGETDWSLTGQHTGLSDIPLTARGERNAVRLGRRLEGLTFSQVLTSPLRRAQHTCQLAGFAVSAEIDPDLVEWDYGQYEGMRSDEIHAINPGWDLFRDGAPGGESIADISGRSDRVIARVRSIDGNVLVFSSGHFLRVFAARWLGLDASTARCFALDTAALSILGYEHDKAHPIVRLWNDTRHVGE
jgi:broad specificity phosphatase PhoE